MTRRYVTTPRSQDGASITKIIGVLGGVIVAIVSAAYHVVVGGLVIVALIILVALLVSRLFGCGCNHD